MEHFHLERAETPQAQPSAEARFFSDVEEDPVLVFERRDFELLVRITSHTRLQNQVRK